MPGRRQFLAVWRESLAGSNWFRLGLSSGIVEAAAVGNYPVFGRTFQSVSLVSQLLYLSVLVIRRDFVHQSLFATD